MVKVYLIRHGQTVWNVAGKFQGQSDVELSEAGIEQANKLVAKYPLPKFDAIFSSPLVRAKKTAETVASKIGISVQTYNEFKEVNFGDWEGMTYKEICQYSPEAIGDFWDAPDQLKIPGGETFQQVQDRAFGKLLEIVSDFQSESSGKNEDAIWGNRRNQKEASTNLDRDKIIAVFAHGAVIRTMLSGAMGLPIRNMWRIRQDNTAVNIIRFDGSFRNIELINDTCHLRG